MTLTFSVCWCRELCCRASSFIILKYKWAHFSLIIFWWTCHHNIFCPYFGQYSWGKLQWSNASFSLIWSFYWGQRGDMMNYGRWKRREVTRNCCLKIEEKGWELMKNLWGWMHLHSIRKHPFTFHSLMQGNNRWNESSAEKPEMTLQFLFNWIFSSALEFTFL